MNDISTLDTPSFSGMLPTGHRAFPAGPSVDIGRLGAAITAVETSSSAGDLPFPGTAPAHQALPRRLDLHHGDRPVAIV
jgi:hypothetical protein